MMSTALLFATLLLSASPLISDEHSKSFEWKGSAIHYLDAGEGDEALVLIHGWASSTVAWKHQFPIFEDFGRVLVIDLPGHGESGAPKGAYSMALFADAVVATMDDAQVAKAVLVGHSNGTPVALNVYRRHPTRVLGLVAVDGALKPAFGREAAERMFAPFRGEGWEDYLSAMIHGMAGRNLSAEDREMLVEMAVGTRHEAVVGGFEAALDPRAWSKKPVEIPLLAVLAEQPTWDANYEAWVREHVPDVDYRVWSGVSHFLHVERPDAFARALDEFLRANDLLETPEDPEKPQGTR